MREQDESAAKNTGVVATLFRDAMASLGVMESSMSVRLTPRFATFLEHSGRWLSIVAVSFYGGMLAMHREPTPLEKAIHRVELRSQLLAEERKFEKEVRQKDAVSRNPSDVAATQKE